MCTCLRNCVNIAQRSWQKFRAKTAWPISAKNDLSRHGLMEENNEGDNVMVITL